jgi:ADP-ribose pyrophosphatase YjhB (NUDIX family)
MNTNNWQIIDEVEVYSNNWIAVQHYNVINPNGGKGIYGKVSFKNIATGIVPIDEDGNTWLVGQYRFPLNKYSWEIPEGGCPLNEDPLAAAKRELLEETGLVAKQWQQLFTMDLSNSVTNEVAVIYIAQQLSIQQACPEETEQLQVKKISLSNVFKMVNNNEITDAISVAALQKVELMMLKNELI